MAFETGKETVICPHCGAEHSVRWHRIPFREPFKLICKCCGETMREGRSIADYDDPKLI